LADIETRRRIDEARDILVGKVPDPKSQVEQITIALTYKFMDDMDQEAIELGGKASFFVGEYEKYGWSQIFDPRLGGFDLINVYSEALTIINENKNIPQLFRDIFKNAFLPYRDPETLKSFLKVINGFTYDHSEKLGDAYEYLLSVLSSQGDAGQFRTPRHIIDFIVKTIDPKKNETILDPACGTAGFLISSYRHILQQNTKDRPGDQLTPDDKKRLINNFVGYDISPDMVRLSLMNMYLHLFQNPKIYEYDTLTSEERWQEYYDVIMANPPFMTPKGGIKPHKRFSVQAKRSEVLFVDYIMEHLNAKGRAGVIVPEGIIFQSQNAYKDLRKQLVEGNYLYAVVSLPAGIFHPYSGVKTSILFMDKTLAKQKDEILFVKINNDGYDLGAQRRDIKGSDIPEVINIIKDYQDGIDVSDHALVTLASKNDIAEQDYILVGDRYKEAVIYDSEYKVVKLEDITSVITCGVAARPEYVENGIPFLSSQNVKSGNVVWSNYKYITLEDHNKLTKNNKPEKGDILYTRVGSFGDAAVINIDEEFSVFVSLTLIKPIRNLVNSYYLKHVLNSDRIKELAKNSTTGIGVQNLNVNTVRKFKIPLPPLRIQEEIVKEIESYQKIADGAKQVVENYKPSIKIQTEWNVTKLGDICTLVRGSSPRPQGDPQYYGGNIPRLLVSDVTRDGMYVTPKIDSLTEQGSKLSRPMKKDEVVMAVSGNPGLPAILNVDACIHDGFVGFRELDFKILPKFFYYVLLKNKVANDSQSVGAIFKNLNTEQIKAFKIPVPSIEVQQQIVAQMEEEQKLVDYNKRLIEIFEGKIKAKINEVWGD